MRKVKSEHNITIISITHDLSEAMEADHVIVMNKGTVYRGTAIEIFDHAEELTTIGLDLPFPNQNKSNAGIPNIILNL